MYKYVTMTVVHMNNSEHMITFYGFRTKSTNTNV